LLSSVPPENIIIRPSREEEQELREGLRARSFADDAIDVYVTVDEARGIIRSRTPEECMALRARRPRHRPCARHGGRGNVYPQRRARRGAETFQQGCARP